MEKQGVIREGVTPPEHECCRREHSCSKCACLSKQAETSEVKIRRLEQDALGRLGEAVADTSSS